ncbi:hypothetical protein V6M85_00390 [Sulfolobus tengchongensis]|uniref:Uncharacterized protein n=1 Tax=Sulfolobus tengchongensis TaxID=207809 RepID=A0AAX4L327_9CREN
MNLVSYYKLEALKINDIITLYRIQKIKDMEVVDSTYDLESIMPDDSSDIVIIQGKDEKYINGKLNFDFQFSRPLNVTSIGLPQQLNGDSVQLMKIEVNADNVIGGSLIKKDFPFIVFYTDDGTKMISISDINPPIPEKKQTTTSRRSKKKKKRSKKRAKKSSSRSKSKSKSSRKS